MRALHGCGTDGDDSGGGSSLFLGIFLGAAFVITALQCSKPDPNVEKERIYQEIYQELRENGTPITEKVYGQRITVEGDTLRTERLDTVAWIVPDNKLAL